MACFETEDDKSIVSASIIKGVTISTKLLYFLKCILSLDHHLTVGL